MMNNYQSEQLENIRRTAERGKNIVEDVDGYPIIEDADIFIHILDIVETIKNNNSMWSNPLPHKPVCKCFYCY